MGPIRQNGGEMKVRTVRLAAMVVVAIATAGLLAANASAVTPFISAFNEPGIYSYHYWQPSTATITPGGSVKFENPYATTYHGLKFTGGTAGETPTCTGIPAAAGEPIGAFHWEGECKFTKVGTYTFICTVHPLEMTGTITVTNGEPTVTTGAASSVGETEATLNGTVNPNGKSTKYHFKWGETAAYGKETTVPPAIEGSSNTPVSANLSGLTPGKLYHYRLVAENEAGPAEGTDHTFTTLKPPPPPPPPPTTTTSETPPPPPPKSNETPTSPTLPLVAPLPPVEEGFKLGPALLAGSAKLTRPRHASAVHGSVEVGQAGAGGRLEVDLTTKSRLHLEGARLGFQARARRAIRASRRSRRQAHLRGLPHGAG